MIKSTGNHQTWVLWEMPWDMTWAFLLIRCNVLLSNLHPNKAQFNVGEKNYYGIGFFLLSKRDNSLGSNSDITGKRPGKLWAFLPMECILFVS